MLKNIIGQEQAKSFFSNVIKEQRLAHSYLFVGPAGVGKFLFARELARTILCQNKTGSDNCRNCLKINHNNHHSLRIIQTPQGKKNIPIEDIRELEREISLKPFDGEHKIFIIDDAETLSAEAANALLKTLEEPPAYSLLVIITDKPELLPLTILSRCHSVRFYPLPDKLVFGLLAKKLGLPEAEIKVLTALSGGSIGQAITLHQKGFSSQRHRLLNEILESDLLDSPQARLRLADEILSFGKQAKDNEGIRFNIAQQFKIIALFLRDLLLLKSGLKEKERLFNQDKISLLDKAKPLFSPEALRKSLYNLIQAEEYLKTNLNINLIVANTIFNL